MRRPEQARPDINVTPLVDVVLVLLIIFMVVLPRMEAGAAVNVPGIRHPDVATDAAHGPLFVSVTADGQLFLEKQHVEREQLVGLLQKHHAAAPDRRLVLKGDRDARYGDLRAIFKECQGIGFPGVSLQVGARREEKAK